MQSILLNDSWKSRLNRALRKLTDQNDIMRLLTVSLALLSLIPGAACAQLEDPTPTLNFERGGGTPAATGWGGGPPPTLAIDSTVVHGGRYSGRIERDSASGESFSTFTLQLPRTFAGDSIALRGWVRTDGVEGTSAIWMRLDGSSSPVQFATTQQLAVSGTTDWTEYRIAVPLDHRARSLTVGALLAGSGTMWVDDLDLLVDGGPAAEAGPAEVVSDCVRARS